MLTDQEIKEITEITNSLADFHSKSKIAIEKAHYALTDEAKKDYLHDAIVNKKAEVVERFNLITLIENIIHEREK